jgi:hypothetical protein
MRVFLILAPVLGLSLACAAVAAPAAAGASHPARSAASKAASADAGYAITGKYLTTVETWVTLPKPARFASHTGTIGASLQLWTATSVIDLRVSACTDATCMAGGRPGNRAYHAVLDVYDRATHALECSTTAKGADRCPAPIGSFSRKPIKPGRNIMLAMAYVVPYDNIMINAGPRSYIYWLPYAPSSKPSLNFTQARIAAEFGSSPWARPDFRLGRGKVRILSFDRPKPPPYAAEIVNYAGRAAGISSKWWGHRKVATRPGPPYATATSLWDDGYGLTVYLKRS